ncbi:hypothetical protein JXM67_11375 [candidate division WOR-3 bacterium]|nr:hypothetical protein [candidate division WOR-3 bacterium]
MNKYALLVLPITIGAAAVALNLIVFSGRKVVTGREYYDCATRTSPWAQSYFKQGHAVPSGKQQIGGVGIFFSVISILGFLASLVYAVWRFLWL